MNKSVWFVLAILFAAALTAAPLVLPDQARAVTLEEAIAQAPQGTEKGQINPQAEPGYLGIPGGPKVNLILALIWSIWVGWIFSTVGAFGGIMAGVGHITIFGLANYAKSFKETTPTLSKMLTDSIRVSNQYLVGLSALISTVNYWKMGRLVLSLAICLSIGSIAASTLVPILTAGKVNLSAYLGYFGLCVLLLSGFLIYKITPMGQASNKAAKAAAQAFEKAVKEKKEGTQGGVKVVSWGLGQIVFTFYGVQFKFNPFLPVIGGFVIAAVASFLGVGGGFLLVPYMTALMGLPMFIVAGTSALAVLIGMISSIFSYMFIMGVTVSWSLIGAELVGIFIGSMIGPRTSKYIPEKWLQLLFIVLALYVGLEYTSRGFFGFKIIPH
ncbi:MAG: sulfite exporter TauE/SafE family protein [Pseudomonadota bacterium]